MICPRPSSAQDLKVWQIAETIRCRRADRLGETFIPRPLEVHPSGRRVLPLADFIRWKPDLGSVREISNGALRVARVLSTSHYWSQPLDVRLKVKQMIRRIIEVMSGHNSQCTAVDFSRLAWMSISVEDLPSALTWTERGLSIDPDNVYCLILPRRLGRLPFPQETKAKGAWHQPQVQFPTGIRVASRLEETQHPHTS